MKVLVTGANGYIGTRLVPLLASLGHHIVAVVRDRSRMQVPEQYQEQIEVIESDLSEDTLRLPRDIEAAYYLIHTLRLPSGEFKEADIKMAEKFVDYLDTTLCRQVIYLTGLISDAHLSEHLSSRLCVEDILKKASCAFTILRAGIVIGAGSASFEIIRDLTEKIPFMVAPKWVSKLCQPISVKDVMEYLSEVLGHEKCLNCTFDIGGPDVLSYKDFLMKYAKIRGLKRYIQVVPVLTPRLSSLWLCLVTSTNFQIARNLVNSMSNNAVCGDHSIQEIIPKQCLTYDQSVKRAFERIEDNSVISSWKDSFSFSKLPPHLSEFVQLPTHACFIDERRYPFDNTPENVFESALHIGGKNGYYWDWAWKIRGWIDKLVGGVGLNRGKVRRKEPRPGDAIDFWRIILVDKKRMRFLLFAEMKVPGEAWLELSVDQKHQELVSKAIFRPKGVWGRIYWYVLCPVHSIIFKGIVKKLVDEAQPKETKSQEKTPH